MGTSFHTVFLLTAKGAIIAEIPKISKIFAIFEPTIFPNATPVFPFSALVMETTNSGADVPNATTVNPITIGLIRNFNAREDAPSTSQSADFIKITSPTINNTIVISILDILSCFLYIIKAMGFVKNITSDIKNHTKRYVRLLVTGFSMGVADLIPGVSGGTIAFLSGIYEELIYSIKLVTGDVLRLFLRGKIKQGIALIPFSFLVPLALGLFTAIFTLANILSFLLENYPVFVWAFFFGLVLASTVIVMKRVVKWDLSDKIGFVVATIGAYILVGLVPVETPNNLPFFFLSGMIAIVAMILPGISGSFILLLLGKYQQVLAAVTERNFVTLITFALGCLFGIALFSRVLSWLFKRHHDISVAILAGFMLGSVRKIWPWKEVVLTRINSHGVEVPLVENNILPSQFDLSVLFAIVLAVFAAFLVYRLDKMQLVKEQTKDVESKEFEKDYKASLKNQ